MDDGGTKAMTDDGLGELLVARGKLDAAGLDRAWRIAVGHGERLASILTKLGLVGEEDLAAGLAELTGRPLVEARHMPAEPLWPDAVSPRFLRQRRVLAIAETEDGPVVAMADPFDQYAVTALTQALGRAPVLCVAAAGVIEAAIRRLYGDGAQGGDGLDLEPDPSDDMDVERLRDLASEAPVIQLVNRMVGRAIETRASDIHIEPNETEVRVRYRIDGVLQQGEPLPDRFRAAVVSRIKIMARLDIAERRLPQDGRVKTVFRGKAIDLRVSTLPILHGESVVIRVLDRDSVALEFASLGVREPHLGRLTEILGAPNGIFLVTGPTGSGKTTTLYAALCRINTAERKVLTVEDPVEYQIDGVNQVQVKPAIGLGFASVLRSMLRQDPDIIMIGEIRDGETARIAAQAALTGHIVLSTLHTNDAPSAVTRLLDIGVDDYLLTSTLTGIAAQRLVRRLCPDCRSPYQAMPEIVEQFGLARLAGGGEVTLWKAVGCEACNHRGYRGRTLIMEVLPLSDAIRALVLKRAETREIQRQAVAEGMRTMFEDGLHLALEGVTTLEDVLRTTREG